MTRLYVYILVCKPLPWHFLNDIHFIIISQSPGQLFVRHVSSVLLDSPQVCQGCRIHNTKNQAVIVFPTNILWIGTVHKQTTDELPEQTTIWKSNTIFKNVLLPNVTELNFANQKYFRDTNIFILNAVSYSNNRDIMWFSFMVRCPDENEVVLMQLLRFWNNFWDYEPTGASYNRVVSGMVLKMSVWNWNVCCFTFELVHYTPLLMLCRWWPPVGAVDTVRVRARRWTEDSFWNKEILQDSGFYERGRGVKILWCFE